jgi:hypothetical protein
MNSLSEARFSRISLSVERFMRIVMASLAICWRPSVPVFPLDGHHGRTYFVISNENFEISYG